jgi:single-stranded DNA-binding protein
MSLWRTTVDGTVGNEPELRTTPSGKSVLSFTLYHHPHGTNDSTTIRVSVWGKYGEVMAKHIPYKGYVVIEGRPSIRKWEKDGVERLSFEVSADTVIVAKGGNVDPDIAGRLGATVESEIPNGSAPF